MFEDARTNIPWKNSTPLFTAPECEMGELSVSIGKANDIWSLGVTLYCFVHGRCPFEDINPVELNRKIKQEEPYYSSNLSATLRDLLKMMLKKSPNDRITVKRIKKHAWVTQNGKSPMISSDKNCISEEVTEEDVKNAFRPAGELVSKLVNHLKNFRKKSKSSNPQARSLSTKRCTSTSLIHG
jgi:serine/threonine protein kinase